jgi:hypothetical protein
MSLVETGLGGDEGEVVTGAAVVPGPLVTPARPDTPLAGDQVFDALKVVAVVMVIVYISSTGKVSELINCSVRNLIERHLWLRHIVFIVSIFLIRSLVIFEKQFPESSLSRIWVFTFSVYALFILATKSKWYFVLTAVTLLFLGENLKIFDDNNRYTTLNSVLFYSAITIVVVGFLHYLYLQKRQRGKKFSFYTFWFGSATGCESLENMKVKDKKGGNGNVDRRFGEGGDGAARLLMM